MNTGYIIVSDGHYWSGKGCYLWTDDLINANIYPTIDKAEKKIKVLLSDYTTDVEIKKVKVTIE